MKGLAILSLLLSLVSGVFTAGMMIVFAGTLSATFYFVATTACILSACLSIDMYRAAR